MQGLHALGLLHLGALVQAPLEVQCQGSRRIRPGLNTQIALNRDAIVVAVILILFFLPISRGSLATVTVLLFRFFRQSNDIVVVYRRSRGLALQQYHHDY